MDLTGKRHSAAIVPTALSVVMPPDCTSAHDARVADRVTAGLRPDREAVRSAADRDLVQQPAVLRADRVDDRVVAAAEPEDAAVCGDAAHVRAAAAGQAPLVELAAG